MSTEPGWTAPTCALPAAERPLRLAEFDALFATALRHQSRPAPTRLRLVLDAAAEATAPELTAREAACCSFFAFSFTRAGGELVLDVDVPAASACVLDALAARATAAGAGPA
jgi:hypothetical protein